MTIVFQNSIGVIVALNFQQKVSFVTWIDVHAIFVFLSF